MYIDDYLLVGFNLWLCSSLSSCSHLMLPAFPWVYSHVSLSIVMFALVVTECGIYHIVSSSIYLSSTTYTQHVSENTLRVDVYSSRCGFNPLQYDQLSCVRNSVSLQETENFSGEWIPLEHH